MTKEEEKLILEKVRAFLASISCGRTPFPYHWKNRVLPINRTKVNQLKMSNKIKEQSKELCGFGCGRKWDEIGDENGFLDCISAYHHKKTHSIWKQQLEKIIYEQEINPQIRVIFQNRLEKFILEIIRKRDKQWLSCLPKEKKPPYQKDDFEIEIDKSQVLTEITLRNALKHLQNQMGAESRNSYNNCRDSFFENIKNEGLLN